MKLCKHCNKDCTDLNKSQFANHTRWCEYNPKNIQYRVENSNRIKKQIDDRLGEIVKFDVICDVCSRHFYVDSRKGIFDHNKKYHCSRNCANSKGGVARSKILEENGELHYKSIAAKYHEIICIICGEDKIVAIHHYDNNHHNNDPKNLVPLCPTHHGYVHSRYNYLVIDKINEYVKNKWSNVQVPLVPPMVE